VNHNLRLLCCKFNVNCQKLMPPWTNVKPSVEDSLATVLTGSKQQLRLHDEITLLLVRTTPIEVLFLVHIPFLLHRALNSALTERLQQQSAIHSTQQRWARIRTGSDWDNFCCFHVIILTPSKILVVMWFYRFVKR